MSEKNKPPLPGADRKPHMKSREIPPKPDLTKLKDIKPKKNPEHPKRPDLKHLEDINPPVTPKRQPPGIPDKKPPLPEAPNPDKPDLSKRPHIPESGPKKPPEPRKFPDNLPPKLNRRRFFPNTPRPKQGRSSLDNPDADITEALAEEAGFITTSPDGRHAISSDLLGKDWLEKGRLKKVFDQHAVQLSSDHNFETLTYTKEQDTSFNIS